ncbi:MAG: amino acid adenylation domain-containing protein [Stigonema ocellatum SAG 48.90 = DSM 106950]|nr:amino acid adenylation domain-containing protein [Stigonema ocellatum SAG 48.90 = DSM 106950]
MSNFPLEPSYQDFCIHELFQSQVERVSSERASLNPDVVAIIFENQQLTYHELNCRANQLANHLQSLGVGPEVLVGIYMERSLEMVVGLLAILKAGGAYVPLDPAYPQERLTFVLEDAQVPMVLTQQHLTQSLPKSQIRIICVHRDWEVIAQQNKENPISEVTPDNLAYTIYTSGSTGKPKGVQIPHRAVVNFLNSTRLSPGMTEQDRFLAVTTIIFDIAAAELFLPLIVGACVVIVSREVASDGVQLARTLLAFGATVMSVTPATWQLLLKAGWQGSKQLKALCGGEALPQKLANHLLKSCASLWNLYGPTETTVWSTMCQVDLGKSSMCIGRPIANTQVYLLNAQMERVPMGVAGEIYIGGAGLARGYLNRPDLTAERFIPNPFSDEPNARLYKTGDLARYLSDGNIEYVVRIDHQVKIRGFRIELGEIETVLWQHPAVENAVVIAREDIPGDKRLVAYVVSKLQRSLFRNLRSFLKQKLPEYMVPSSFVFLNALPLTPNGKVDRKALPIPDNIRPELEEDFVAPSTPVEEVLAEIWSQVLGLKQIGINDSFLELGGHSLLATQIISRVRHTYQVELPVRELFDRPTVAGLAQSIQTMLLENQNLPVSSIQPTSRNFAMPLSFAQERLWFLDQLVPENPSYNVTEAIRLTGSLNLAALEKSFNEIIRRHETLRTIFATVDGQPVQVIHDPPHFKLSVVNLQELPRIEREAYAQQLATEEGQQIFNLSQGPLLRVTLLQLDDQEYLLLLNLHHILCDDWSLGVLYKELTALYEDFSTGKPSLLPELVIQYADFAIWQRQWLQQKVLEKQLAYWGQQLADLPVLQLPTDRPRPLVPTYQGALEPLSLPPTLTAALKVLSQQEGVTLFMTLLAAFQTLLCRYTNSEDIPVGSAIANRHLPNVSGLIGFFVNTVVLRTSVSGSLSFKELLVRVREVALAAYTHQDLPFEKLVAELQPERNLSRQPLFQVVFALQNVAPSEDLKLSGLKTSFMTIDNKTAKFDLFLQLSETSNGLTGWFEYNTDLFDAATISRMAGHFQTLLEGIVADPEQCLLDLPLLTERERYQLLVEWNNTQVNYPQDASCIHQLFEDRVAENPDAVAVVFEDVEKLHLTSLHLTYGELNCRANQQAHYLRTLGVEPEVLVGICAERSLEMIIGILGILKAGGAYVPLDPAYPKERLAFMLEDANVLVLLTQEQWVERFPSHKSQIICLDNNWEFLAQENEDNPNIDLTANNLAYVIYTSGSTGRPKGVRIEHRGLLNLTYWHQRTFAVSPLDRATQIAGVAFDACVWEIWPYLTAGASIHINTAETLRLPEQLRNWLVSTAITISFLPTPIADQVLLLEWPNNAALRILLTGGDKLLQYPSASHLFQVVNNYGPTENTVVTTSGVVPVKNQTAVPTTGRQSQPLGRLPDHSTGSRCLANVVPAIGRPIANTQVYILDQHLQLVPIGVSGEIYVSGAGLARDYLNQPNLTSERFIPNHFSNKPGERLYKTGDLARYLSDGNIEFLGRIDQQVKLRGFRIELNEIEVVLRQHPAVHMAAIADREDIPGQKQLVAYVVQNPQYKRTPDAAADSEPQLAQNLIPEMRRFLQEKLPDYMVLSAFVLLDALPMTPNGKLDRSALPAPKSTRTQLEEDFVAYRTLVEKQIVTQWMKVLGIENIGINENFFELGGNSLKAAQLIAYIRETFSVELPVRCLFEKPTVEGLAQSIQTLHQEGISAITSVIDFKAEAVLPPEIFPQGTPIDDLNEPRHIFLTGATGFVGAFLLHELLEQTQAKIYCLVRSPNENEGAKRLQKTLEQYLLWNPNQSSKIIPTIGDLEQPLLGLSAEQFERLALQIDTIYHNGAQVNFAKPYSTIKAANVGGTQEVLRLACMGKVKPVHYISTGGIYGPISYFTGIEVIKEEDDIDIAEDYLCMDIGYTQSKWVAEKIVHIAKSRKLPVSIYRLGLVMGDTRTGIGNTADYVSRMIKGCIQLGSYPNLVAQKQELVSVDFVTKAIVHLSNQKKSLGKAFHLVPPPSQNIDFINFFELISSFGYELKKVPYTQWKNELIKQTQQSQDNALYPLVPMLAEQVYQDSLSIAELYQNTPEFDCKNTLDGLAGTSIVCPPMDDKLLETYFSYFIRSGFLASPYQNYEF